MNLPKTKTKTPFTHKLLTQKVTVHGHKYKCCKCHIFFLWLFMSLFVEPRVCGWAVLPAELPGGRAAELPVSKPLPLEPRRRDGHMLHPPKQEAPHPFTECQCPSTHAAFDAHTPTRAAGAQHHPHPAPQHQVSSGFPKNRGGEKTLLSFNLCALLVLEPICLVAFVFRSQWRQNSYDPLINFPFGKKKLFLVSVAFIISTGRATS